MSDDVGLSQDRSKALEALRAALLDLKPTGADGFESLVATALAAFTGLTFRLAKSGSQFGRDASSSPAPFAIAMEAKRYADSQVGLEDLAGKLALAEHSLAGNIDLWVLGATSEVGDDTIHQLAGISNEKGLSVLVLDWAPRPLPPLAVLLAAARDATLGWFAERCGAVVHDTVLRALDFIVGSPCFASQREELNRQASAPEVGLDALRRWNADWLHSCFGDRAASKRAFNQAISVEDKAAPALPRTIAGDRLRAAMRINPEEIGVVAVLGEEGVGKTWLVAKWWEDLETPPVLIPVIGYQAASLDPTEPLRSLARLLAKQQERSDDATVAGYERRLRRWRNRAGQDKLRFVLFFDGLNEHGSTPWSDILRVFAPYVHAFGGLVVVTTREGFWRWAVEPRLGTLRSPLVAGDVVVRKVQVENYADEELTAVLDRVGRKPADLPIKVKDFVRNPRVCAVAISLLDRLTLQPAELTIERLLLEYWKHRMEERGDRVRQTVQEFHKLLRSHARAWLNHPDRPFARDEWIEHSAAARRRDGRSVHDDLTEIEEGRFMEITGDDEAYRFRQESLPYALALLITHELESGLKSRGVNASEILDGILEPVQGFDLVAQIVEAATGLACLRDGYPDDGRRALIVRWLSLQNVDDHAIASMSAYVQARPEAFLEVAELSARDAPPINRDERLLRLLLATRDHPRVRSALSARLPRWQGGWSRKARTIIPGDEQMRIQMTREARIAEKFAALSPEERRIFDTLCSERQDIAEIRLDLAGALIMAGRPQAHLATGLVGWSFAQAIAQDFRDASDELEWVVRLNKLDHCETERAVKTLVEHIGPSSSEPARRAAAIVLDLVGTQSAAEISDLLIPPTPSMRWRRFESFCDTNPYDPNAAAGSNLDNARAVLKTISPTQIWNHFGPTVEDGDLSEVTPALARFDADPLVQILRQIVRSIEDRSQLAFRQLAWRLPELSPLFDSQTIEAIRSAYARLLSDTAVVRDHDFEWITSRLVTSLTPHLEAEQQLDILLRLPARVPEFVDLRRALKPLTAAALERRLEHSLERPDSSALRRTLFFASAGPAVLTDRAREIIAAQFNSSDIVIAGCASDIAYRSKDPALNSMVLEQAELRPSDADHPEEARWRARAVATAVVERQRPDLVRLVAPRFLGYVAAALGGDVVDRLANHIEHVLDRLLQQVMTPRPMGAQLVVRTSSDGLEVMKTAEDLREEGELLEMVGTPESSVQPIFVSEMGHEKRQQEIADELQEFEKALAAEGAAAAATAPELDGLTRVVEHDPERVRGWLNRILATVDARSLDRIRNIGTSLAGAYAVCDGEKAAAVFRWLRDTNSLVSVSIGEERIPLYEDALFRAGSVAALDQLREEVFASALDDEVLEVGVASVEACGAETWFDAYLQRLLQSTHPADQARGLTLAGFRRRNSLSDGTFKTQARRAGFLGRVDDAASKAYRRDRWARHWFKCASTTEDPIEFWCFGQLAVGVADRRFVGWFEEEKPSGSLIARFGSALYRLLSEAAEARTKKRRDTLFGIKAPDRDLITALRND